MLDEAAERSARGGILEYVASVHMMEMEAHRFREEAEQCRVLAAQAVSPIDREAWLRLAEDWEKLADKAAKGRGFLAARNRPSN
ncbi:MULTISPECIES: hypothetical protein [unclassified Bradyrhizobium]|uniref:hypothetical protein n=1 Tax=unclassified Bradyrhizobium TaxID=2631580 RepID=UPI002305B468|nr:MULTISPECIES: hypothetical protein [unclassified Bradyrhizobium]MDA9415124.1 hypothetical protein [Bradyrhizobium sp. CCBAU 25360]MDA9448726.1 hypothetical protein [Bradyrhizobium sp. CCBAU 21360]MDA9454030.1 hypothetical protein [Bradyrhizobium sp. CCBAU 21359]MDA9515042.1 hypothetical protein [Bradyrhizobium sp. CCBAU 11430]